MICTSIYLSTLNSCLLIVMEDEASILDLLRKQNEILQEQTQALRDLKGLMQPRSADQKRNESSSKHPQPTSIPKTTADWPASMPPILPVYRWNDERGWSAAFRTSLAEARARVATWKNTLDGNFLFVSSSYPPRTSLRTRRTGCAVRGRYHCRSNTCDRGS